MAISNSGMTLYTNNNSQESWSGSDDYDAEVSNDGGGAESWLVSKNGNETATLSLTANMGTSKYFNFWMKSDWGAFYTQIDATLSDGSNDNLFVVATGGKHTTPNSSPEISGDFKPSILQISEGDNASYDQANHATIAINIDASSSGNIRSITNHWIDGMWFGSGREISGTSISDKLFAESDDLDTSSADYDGCSKVFDAGLAFYTDIKVSTSDGKSYGEVVTWYGKSTTDGKFNLEVLGTVVFHGTTLIGNDSIISLGATSATSFDMVGGGITNGGVISLSGSCDIDGAVFSSCAMISPNAGGFNNCTINNTTEVVTGAVELITDTDLSVMSNLTFNSYSGTYALYIPDTITGTITLNNFVGDGSGTDVYWNGSAGELIINKSNGTNFTTSSSAGGTVSLVSSVSINVNVKDSLGNNIDGALVYIDEDLDVVGEIINTTTDSNGDVATSYSGGATSATIRVRKYGYKANVGSISLSSDSNTNVVLITDPQQS